MVDNKSNAERVAIYVRNLVDRGEKLEIAVVNAILYFTPQYNDKPRYRK